MNLIHHSPDFPLSEANLTFVTEKLNRMLPPIPSESNVQFDVHRNQHHLKGDVFQIRLQLSVKGELLIGQETAPDYQTAVELALDKLQAQYRRYHEKQAGHNRGLWHKVSKYFNPDSLE